MSDEMNETEVKAEDMGKATQGREDEGRNPRAKGKAFFHKKVCRSAETRQRLTTRMQTDSAASQQSAVRFFLAASQELVQSTRESLQELSSVHAQSASCHT